MAATGFPMWDVKTALRRQISAERVIVFADACHSAGINDEGETGATMSLQLFAQPLLSSGDYVSYKQLIASETFDFDVFEEGRHQLAGQVDTCVGGRTCVDAIGRRHIDFDGDGTVDYSLGDRDFNVRSLVGNLVFRWEYRPGSTLFLVWQRRQEDEVSIGNFDFQRDFDALISAPAENVLMVKLNYWFAMQ